MAWAIGLLVCALCAVVLRAGKRDADSEPPRETPSQLLALPDALLEHIGAHLCLIDALAWRCTCRAMNCSIGEACNRRVDAQHSAVIDYFPDHVFWSLPRAVWYDVEWVDFDPAWMGATGYIDRVTAADLPGRPFKCCRDSYGRLALIMRRKNDVAALFQRYMDSTETWVFASDTLPVGGCRLSESMVARLALWLSRKHADSL